MHVTQKSLIYWFFCIILLLSSVTPQPLVTHNVLASSSYSLLKQTQNTTATSSIWTEDCSNTTNWQQMVNDPITNLNGSLGMNFSYNITSYDTTAGHFFAPHGYNEKIEWWKPTLDTNGVYTGIYQNSSIFQYDEWEISLEGFTWNSENVQSDYSCRCCFFVYILNQNLEQLVRIRILDGAASISGTPASPVTADIIYYTNESSLIIENSPVIIPSSSTNNSLEGGIMKLRRQNGFFSVLLPTNIANYGGQWADIDSDSKCFSRGTPQYISFVWWENYYPPIKLWFSNITFSGNYKPISPPIIVPTIWSFILENGPIIVIVIVILVVLTFFVIRERAKFVLFRKRLFSRSSDEKQKETLNYLEYIAKDSNKLHDKDDKK